jgi:transcriptional regulator with XRE-family HTH domain
MKLADFMHEHDLSPRQMRWMLGVKSRSTVLRYLSGERMPSPEQMRRIHQVTEGRVTLADFLDPAPPKCVRVVIDRHGTPRQVYPWTDLETTRRVVSNDNGPGRRSPELRYPDSPPADAQESLTPPEKLRQLPDSDDMDEWPSRPLHRAISLLEHRVRRTRRGKFLLDGRISDPKRIVAAANRILRARGEPPIPYPGVDPL